MKYEFKEGGIETTHNPDYLQVVVVCAVWQEKVLFIRRTTPPFLGYLSIPGGGVEAGESYRNAAHRELEEETSIIAQTLQPMYVYVDHTHSLECHAFKFESPDGVFSNPDPSEQEVVGWIGIPEALQQPLTPGLNEALKKLSSVG